MTVMASVSEEWDGAITALPSRPDDCFYCEEYITNDERPFFWYGAVKLFLHQACLLDWLPRVIADAERIKSEPPYAA